jgi:hypothetical protein
MSQAHCPDCGTETEWIATVEQSAGRTSVDRFQALCDGCQADRAVKAAFRGTDY